MLLTLGVPWQNVDLVDIYILNSIIIIIYNSSVKDFFFVDIYPNCFIHMYNQQNYDWSSIPLLFNNKLSYIQP